MLLYGSNVLEKEVLLSSTLFLPLTPALFRKYVGHYILQAFDVAGSLPGTLYHDGESCVGVFFDCNGEVSIIHTNSLSERDNWLIIVKKETMIKNCSECRT